ncbi:type I methionyl aminopeptidase [Nakamurella endophytica]|uniref:Methionine aminopeptidase n=1 Tax=Nakamurella endophytica TaxID=1748367 RepID=A0A917SZA0_9ACTN|nr:type I methionyl aminopeptidase [Nakamurella endophytica]GGM03250.1 methionine aminopeptidase [Nakamurella endophytica]
MGRSGGVEYKTRTELQSMRAAGLVLAEALEAARAVIRPGVSTADVDDAVAAVLAEHGATSNFLGYGDPDNPFPATICASVNDEIVHGIPSRSRILVDGDLLSVDAGCVLDGWHADSAFSVHVGEPPSVAEVDLLRATESAMWAGIAAIRDGGRLGDVSHAIESSAERSGHLDGRRYGSVEGYGGHGIGRAMHMEPFVPNQGRRGKGPRLAAGMALAIEPMLALGKASTVELPDGWTVSTRDGARSAHFEHSVAVLADGVCVLTARDGGAAGLAPYGVVPVSLD